MTGRDPLQDLRDLAELGERAARPAAPEEIRTRGERRGRRRRAGAAVAALAVAVLAGAVGFSVVSPSVLPSPSGPADRPTVTADPGGTLSEANLPTESDLEFYRPSDWKVVDTRPGAGSEPASECFQESLESLGSVAAFHRRYDFDGARGSATALQFGSEDEAGAAYRTLDRWGVECEQTLRDLGHRRTKVYRDGTEVAVPAGEARFRVIATDRLDDPKDEMSPTEEYGLIRSGTRVEIVIMGYLGLDHNWSVTPEEAKETGLDLDPMIRSLPKAAARLAGEPSSTAPPTRPLAEGNLVQPEDLPVHKGQQAEQFDRNARPDQRPSTCFAERLDTLGPTDLRVRSFRYVITDPDTTPDTDDPLYEQPTTYTGALQFVDEATAEAAYDKLSGWIEDCADALDREGFRAPGGGPVRGFDRWYPVRGPLDTARFTEFSYQRRDLLDGAGYFEAVGLVRVGDRVAVAVTVVYGQDSLWDTDPDADVAGPHPLADLLPIAAKRLGS